MKNPINLLKGLFISSAMLLSACANSKTVLSPEEKQSIQGEVLQASQQWIKNFNEGNVQGIVDAYTANAVMNAKPFGTFQGTEAILGFWKPFVESGAGYLEYSDVQTTVINSKTVQLSASWTMNVGKGIITNETWVKQSSGTWKLEEDHFEVQEQFKRETFVLVHSAWLGAWQWQGVTEHLKAQGHIVITPDLPGHGQDKTPIAQINMDAYVKTITDILDTQKEPVHLVGHSFNGITISRAAELRPKKVKDLTYLTAFLVPNGVSFFKAVQGVKGSKAVENFFLSDDKAYAFVKEDELQNAFAHDIPKEAFDQAKGFIVPEPANPLAYELQVTDANFGSIPKYYIECTEDRAIPIEVQRAMYKGKVVQAFSINSSHTPNFSQPAKVAEILGTIATK